MMQKCTACNKAKKDKLFTIDMHQGKIPFVCHYCKHGQKFKDPLKSKKLESNEKVCLCCDTPFVTSKNNRICKSCKNSENWKEGDTDYSIIIGGN